MFLGCPHRYWLGMVHGWRAKSNGIDVTFGSWVHLGIETFYRGVIERGLTHDAALKLAVRAVIEASWETDPPVDTTGDYIRQPGPMLGRYVNVWHCLGDVKGYKNAKGNPAKCPYSHAGKFFEGHGPDKCGECGGGTIERLNKWQPESKAKDRYNAIRAVVWYAEEMKESSLKPVSVDGRALVEVNARVQLTSELAFVMNFDAVKAFGEELFIADYKTTGMTLSKMYFSRFMPNIQVDAYGTLAPFAAIAAIDNSRLDDVSGVVVEGIQVLVSGIRFGAQLFRMDKAYRKEVIDDIMVGIETAHMYADKLGPNVAWPKNRSACTLCPFKVVCASAPEHREAILAEHFERRRWNPVTRTAEAVDERRNRDDAGGAK